MATARNLNPFMESSEIFSDKLKFTRVNMFESVENLGLAEGLGVQETPTVKLFHKSKEIGEIIGFKTLEDATEELETIIKESSFCKQWQMPSLGKLVKKV